MTIIMYDLAAAEPERRISPYCRPGIPSCTAPFSDAIAAYIDCMATWPLGHRKIPSYINWLKYS
jgi:hypothetical protein